MTRTPKPRVGESEDRDSAIFEARANGRSAKDVAREFGLTVKEVDRITTAKIEEQASGAAVRQSIGFAAHRLEQAEIKFHNRSMEGDGDAASQMVAVKCNERRMTMLGGNAPAQYSVYLSNQAAPPSLTSTEKIARALDRLEGRHSTVSPEEEPPPSGPH